MRIPRSHLGATITTPATFAPSGNPTVDSLSLAIAQMEGYNTPGTIAARQNNPGNLRSSSAASGTASGYAVFSDPASGWGALQGLIQSVVAAHPGITLDQFFGGQRDASGHVVPGGYSGYAPAADSNNPTNYAAFVGSSVGIDPTAPLDLSSLDLSAADTVDTTGDGVPDSGSPDLTTMFVAAGSIIGLALLWTYTRG